MTQEFIILVNDRDEKIGTMEKLEAHKQALLHRAFSIFVFNDQKQLLLQQRASSKYHSPNLWTNTCCGHPKDERWSEEEIESAAHRRLQEEMWISVDLTEKTKLIYKLDVGNSLIEHEYLHVFIGKCNESPHPNSQEAKARKRVSKEDLLKDISANQSQYTKRFVMLMQKYVSSIWPS